ncbi:hypothetical protein GQ55_3G260800 [Panicum hallii var. hallii]|uniref:Uncharacterized protein n=1 Tax=Panicum hallii var. hallii TaxID=1504633 RepID=A0A2T7EDH4_9POAL|nr:hypothetical protein GQ55_3G260800 [Panicum hallii var. hallii]
MSPVRHFGLPHLPLPEPHPASPSSPEAQAGNGSGASLVRFVISSPPGTAIAATLVRPPRAALRADATGSEHPPMRPPGPPRAAMRR